MIRTDLRAAIKRLHDTLDTIEERVADADYLRALDAIEHDLRPTLHGVYLDVWNRYHEGKRN